MVHRLNSFSPIDRNFIKVGWWGRLGPSQIRDKRPHIPHSWSQEDLPDYIGTERLFGGHKGGGTVTSLSVVLTSPWASSLGFFLAKRYHAHMGRYWDKPNTDLEPEKWKWLAKGNPEVMLHKSDLNHHEGASLTLSLPVCLSTCTLFPLNELLLLLLSISMEIHFYTAEGPRPCHWLGFGALPAVTWPQALVGNRNPATICCRLRLPEIIATRPWGPETRVCNPVLVCVEKKLTKRQKV